MNNKTISLAIIGLCLLSIIIGIFNTTVSFSRKPSQGTEKGGFGKIFQNQDKIALISLEGEITSEPQEGLFEDANSAEAVRKALARAIKDDSVKGVLIRVDSPGGTVGISQEIYGTIMRLRQKKPVVVSMCDLAASGGYYISSAADRIYADPGTLTGSIGVIMDTFNVQELMSQKLGIKEEAFKSGKFKDIASPYRPLSSDEKSLLQNLINTTYKQFVQAIIDGRVNRKDKYSIKKSVLTLDTLKKNADGRVFTGQIAQKLGFVDQVGGIHEAYEGIKKMANAGDLPLVSYNLPSGLGGLLLGLPASIVHKKDVMSSSIPFSAKYPHQPLFMWE